MLERFGSAEGGLLARWVRGAHDRFGLTHSSSYVPCAPFATRVDLRYAMVMTDVPRDMRSSNSAHLSSRREAPLLGAQPLNATRCLRRAALTMLICLRPCTHHVTRGLQKRGSINSNPPLRNEPCNQKSATLSVLLAGTIPDTIYCEYLTSKTRQSALRLRD